MVFALSITESESDVFMPSTLKKLRGHIAWGLSVHPSFCPSPSVCVSVQVRILNSICQ